MEQGSYLKFSALLQHHIMDSSSPCWNYPFATHIKRCLSFASHLQSKGAPGCNKYYTCVRLAWKKNITIKNCLQTLATSEKSVVWQLQKRWHLQQLTSTQQLQVPWDLINIKQCSSNWLLVKYLLWILISLPR